MANSPTQTITVDRVSNSGNAIADQQHAGKSIHVPAGEVGQIYEVKLVDHGSHFTAHPVDGTERVQPGLGPDTSDIAENLLDPESDKHSFEVRPSTSSGNLRGLPGQEQRSKLSRRKK